MKFYKTVFLGVLRCTAGCLKTRRSINGINAGAIFKEWVNCVGGFAEFLQILLCFFFFLNNNKNRFPLIFATNDFKLFFFSILVKKF